MPKESVARNRKDRPTKPARETKRAGAPSNPGRILRTRDVCVLTGLSRITVWRLERAGQFPKRLKLSSQAIGWRQDEVLEWIESRARGAA